MFAVLAAIFGAGAGAGRADEGSGGCERERGRVVADNMMEYPSADCRLEEATRQARATLPRFFELAEAGLRGSYLLKMALSRDGHTEHVWMEVSDYRDGVFHGRLANEPAFTGHRIGDPATLKREDVEDWMINTSDARYGGYTVRAMLDDMPKKQADALRAEFRD